MGSIRYSANGDVGTIVIDRTERRNAINYEALDDFVDVLDIADRDELRALIIQGAEGHFCAGADLSELEDQDFTRTLRVVLDRIAGLGFPTIAAISGSCMGLGMQLAMACDLRLASREALFAVPVAKLGLMVDFWTIQRLALLAGHSTARQMILTAKPLAAERVFQVGFIHTLVDDPAEVPDAAFRLAHDVRSLAPLSIAGSKLGLGLLERQVEDADPEVLYREAFDRAWSSTDLQEGRLAFSERRIPNFEGR